MNPLHVHIFETARAVVIRLEGDAGLTAAQVLEAPLRQIVVRKPGLVAFDLAGLTFAASLFLGTLVNFRRGVVAGGGRVQFAAVPANIREVLQISRLDQLFEFVDAAPPCEAPADSPVLAE